MALKNVKRNFETLLVKLHKTNNLFSKIVTQKNVIVSQLGQLKVDLKGKPTSSNLIIAHY